jgi:hypothetical protein
MAKIRADTVRRKILLLKLSQKRFTYFFGREAAITITASMNVPLRQTVSTYMTRAYKAFYVIFSQFNSSHGQASLFMFYPRRLPMKGVWISR